MSLQSIEIQGYNSGIQKNKKPFLISEDAFARLYNAYTWRGRVKKREGLKLLGRLRRNFATASIGNSDVSIWTFNIYSVYIPAVIPEINAEIEPGSVVITIQAGPDIVFTDQGNGLLTSPTMGNNGYIDYLTGDISLTHTAGAGVASTGTFDYYPSLPSMGISQRELSAINVEQTIFFDTKYAYIHNGSDFIEFIPGTTWNSTNADFFWTTNYRGSDAQTRLFFETNFIADASNPMRYTNGTTWTTFQPIISATTVTETLGTLTAPWTNFAGMLTNFPIIEGTVVITAGSITFRDTPKDGTLVSSGSNTGTINYNTGAIALTFSPALTSDTTVTATYDYAQNYLFTAKILIPYYGRLLALNTYEGIAVGSSVNIFNRCRFSQTGSPTQQDAWRSDTFGKGGFVDAPTNEAIVSARFYKNTLIVFFERSTWRLQYIGEYGIPFIWERISSDWGSESTFSTVLFDNGVLAVGDKAIVASSGGDVQRIDLDIPDTVYDFRNVDSGTFRVQGIRDFRKELVYWCYPDQDSLGQTQIFPNRTLVYNYRNNTFAFFRNSVTCFGDFQYQSGITWDREDIFWDDDNVFWDTQIQEGLSVVASGNQQGFIHYFSSPDAESSADSSIDANDQESLSVRAVTVTTVVRLTIIDHNLSNGEWVYLNSLNYVVTASASAGSTTLNDKIYNVSVIDKDTVEFSLWSIELQRFYTDFTVTNVGTYVGGGVVALFPQLSLLTKDFNPARQIGQNIQTSYIDFLFDSTPNATVNVELRMNSSSSAIANLIVGNKGIEMTATEVGLINGVALTNPAVITSPNHGLLTGDRILIESILGTVELNNNQYEVTFLTEDTFSINVNATGYTPYVSDGQWIQTNQAFYTLSSEYAWYRFFANSYGQFVSIVISYNNDLMSQLSTHQSDFILNAMQLYYRAAGNNIFGK